ncbi:MAG: ferrous iron transport protein A [Betaproteobacteria bacterium]
MTHLSLTELATGIAAVVQGIALDFAARERLAALGVKPGRTVTVVRRMGARGPLQLRAGQTDVVLRAEDAARIQVSTA